MNIFNPKTKLEILTHLLRDRGVPGTIYFDRSQHQWFHNWEGRISRLGVFVQAIRTIMITLPSIFNHDK